MAFHSVSFNHVNDNSEEKKNPFVFHRLAPPYYPECSPISAPPLPISSPVSPPISPSGLIDYRPIPSAPPGDILTPPVEDVEEEGRQEELKEEEEVKEGGRAFLDDMAEVESEIYVSDEGEQEREEEGEEEEEEGAKGGEERCPSFYHDRPPTPFVRSGYLKRNSDTASTDELPRTPTYASVSSSEDEVCRPKGRRYGRRISSHSSEFEQRSSEGDELDREERGRVLREKRRGKKGLSKDFKTKYEISAWDFMKSGKKLTLEFLRVYKQFLGCILVNESGSFAGFTTDPRNICCMMTEAAFSLKALKTDDRASSLENMSRDALTDQECDSLYSKVMTA